MVKPRLDQPKNCERCGKPTSRTHPLYRFCSSCSVELRSQKRLYYRPNADCEICGKSFYRRRSGKQPDGQRTCSRACGVELRRQEYGTYGGLQGQCSDIGWASCGCGTMFAVRGLKFRRCRACRCLARMPKPKMAMVCKECAGGFLGHERRRYCSDQCAARAQRRHRRHRQREAVRRGPSREPIEWWAQARLANCAECGRSLAGKQRKWCSDRCRDRAYDRHNRHLARSVPHGDPNVPVFTIHEIGERDGWRCHLCRKRVGRRDASLDHLIPIAEGGKHELGNVMLAHHRCNSKRGITGDVQLLLVA